MVAEPLQYSSDFGHSFKMKINEISLYFNKLGFHLSILPKSNYLPLCCFTALSFVDMKELTTDEIVEVNGEKWILSKRHKTNVPFQVKLLDIPLQIIERYKYLSEDKLVFGKINYWTMCKQLKKVMAECGIEKQISYHCARHTFGTLALSKGMPIESVSRVLGHTNIVTTQIYAKITTQKLDNDLTMFGNKLNASFGSVTP